VGALAIVLLLAVLVWRGWRVGLRAPDLFGAYLAFGITVFLAIQTLINLGAVTGLLPTKGLPLPFISFGGSSLLVTMLSTGILLNISQHCWSGAREPRVERGAVPGGVVRARV
jgi:cell division protein FtsW